MKIIKTLFIILSFPGLLNAGNTGASFLSIPPGAAPAGMGGAYTALSGDINALHYNPAGMSSITNPLLGATHTEWVADMRYSYAGGVFHLREGAMGVSAALLTTGEMEGRGADREKTADFAAYDLAVKAGYGKDISLNTAAGVSVKLIVQNIADETAAGFAFDAGMQRRLADNLSLGLAVKNLGPGMKFLNKRYNLPLTVTAGAGLQMGVMEIALDASYGVYDENISVSLGTQWLPMDFIVLRGGYLMNLVKSYSGSRSGIRFDPKDGLGGGVGLNVFDYSINYALVPYSELGTTQRVSLQKRF